MGPISAFGSLNWDGSRHGPESQNRRRRWAY